MNEATQSNEKLQDNFGMVFVSAGSSYIFMILFTNREPDFGLPYLRGGLKAAAIPVLCGNPKSLK